MSHLPDAWTVDCSHRATWGREAYGASLPATQVYERIPQSLYIANNFTTIIIRRFAIRNKTHLIRNSTFPLFFSYQDNILSRFLSHINTEHGKV